MNKPCPNCYSDLKKYGFILEKNGVYMTMVKEIKSCCAIKVRVISFDSSEVKFYTEEEYRTENDISKITRTKSRKDFMTSSWQLKGPTAKFEGE
jgi:hypothetical protein